MYRLSLLLAIIFLGCSSENLPNNIRTNKLLSELEFEVRDSIFGEFSTANGNFYTNDTSYLWYSVDSTELNVCDCPIENDTLKIIIGHSSIFDGIYTTYQIAKDRFDNRILSSFCTTEYYSPTDNSKITLNTRKFKVGDTLIGTFKSFGLASTIDSTKYMNFEGKFRCIIH
jgi:hypothetical protein